uniref:SFRICE_007504 n=1 Tax=Spodoptera frugiperda TaxID=7108 RepID=A0A2H1VUJ4_SPOFR
MQSYGYNCGKHHCCTFFITSRRGNTMINFQGYNFYLKKNSYTTGFQPKQRWVCTTHFGRGCKAIIYTIENVIVKVDNYHTHSPLPNPRFPNNP